MNTGCSRKRRFAVLGVGAVGGLYGGLLAKAGFEVHFLARSDAHFIRKSGLQVDSIWGDFHLTDINVYESFTELPKVDCVVVSWKTTSNHQLESVLPAICHHETVVLMIQNGLDVERHAANVVGASRVLGACAFLCSNKKGPGHIDHLDYGKLAVGAYESSADSLSTLTLSVLDDFQKAGIPTEAFLDLSVIRWKKLAWNIPFNGLSVVLNADTSEMMNHGETRDLAEKLMLEVVECARACGVNVPNSHIQQNLEYTRNMVPYASSMLLDYQNRRQLELDAIFGTPLRFAQQAGYTPLRVQMLYQQLAFLDWRNRIL